MIAIQFLVGLGAMVGGAHLFVVEVIELSELDRRRAAGPLPVLAPLATELPEKANSFFWVREGKDSLALGNITGAMVFQSTMPVAFGLAFTDWDLDRFAVLSAALGLAGGARRILGAAPPGALQPARDPRLGSAVRGLPALRVLA